MKRKIYILLSIVFVFILQQATAQVTINVKSEAAYTAFYAISYTNSGVRTNLTETTIYANGNQQVSIPAGATDISIKTRFKSLFSDYDLTTVAAGRQGGTFTFKGLLGNTSFSWVPIDGDASVASQDFTNIDLIYPNGDAELHRAARESNGSTMQMLIDKGTTRINTKNTRGFTPLHECVQKGFPAGIDILLKAGADVNIQNAMGDNAFVMALGLGKKDLAQKFVDNGYPVGADTKALEAAVKKRNEEMVKFMLDNGADANTAITLAMQQNNIPLVEMIMNSYTPNVTIDLYKKAVDARRFDLAKRVIESNVDVNQAMDYAILKNVPELVQAALEKGGNSQKALKFAIANRKPDIAASAITAFSADVNLVLEDAIKSNQADVITLLLENNADPNAGLTYSINNNKTNLIPLMIEKGAKISPQQISKVAASGDNALLPKLIEAGGDKDAALAGALSAGKYATAEMLIQAGAAPGNVVKIAVDNKQKGLLVAALDAGADANPGLASAINAGLMDYAELLFKAGAKTNDLNLVNAVITKKNLPVLKLMLENQTNPDLGMNTAIAAGYAEAVQLMLDNKANPKGVGFLATAVKSNNLPITEMLVKAGADAKSPELISGAVKNKNLPMVDILVKAGADPKNGLAEAIRQNDVATTKYLITAGADGKSREMLNFSVAKNNADLTNIFIEAGAPFDQAAELAVTGNAGSVLGLLISKGAEVKNPRLLTLAIKNNNPQIVAQLINAGCDMSYKDEQGNNYLHLAAMAEADAVVVSLARAGVKVNDLNNAKDAPIHIAVIQGRSEVKLLEQFLAAGADPNLLNAAGKKPLDITKGTRIKSRLKEAGGTTTNN
ncbi:MAG: ankyrin repeat domain-containing protein [Ginsengibacter sp.]